MRIIQKDAEYHIGQRGPGIQPRSMELYNYLGVLPDLMEAGQTLKRRCAYEMPGGIKPAKIFDLIPYAEPTPAIPYVSTDVALSLCFGATAVLMLRRLIEKRHTNGSSTLRRDLALATGQERCLRRVEHRVGQI